MASRLGIPVMECSSMCCFFLRDNWRTQQQQKTDPPTRIAITVTQTETAIIALEDKSTATLTSKTQA